jgi:hypothetical protein
MVSSITSRRGFHYMRATLALNCDRPFLRDLEGVCRWLLESIKGFLGEFKSAFAHERRRAYLWQLNLLVLPPTR